MRAGWCTFFSAAHIRPSTMPHSPHQDPSFSAWCSQPGPFPTSASFPQPFHQCFVHLARLVTSGTPTPFTWSTPFFLSLSFACRSTPALGPLRISLGPRFSQLDGPVAALAPSGLATLTCALPVSEAQSCRTSSPMA